MRIARHPSLRLRARPSASPRGRGALVAWLIAALLLQGWAFAEAMAGPLDICRAAPASVEPAASIGSAPDNAVLQAHDCLQCAVCATATAPPPALPAGAAPAATHGLVLGAPGSNPPAAPTRLQRARAPPFFV